MLFQSADPVFAVNMTLQKWRKRGFCVEVKGWGMEVGAKHKYIYPSTGCCWSMITPEDDTSEPDLFTSTEDRMRHNA